MSEPKSGCGPIVIGIFVVLLAIGWIVQEADKSSEPVSDDPTTVVDEECEASADKVSREVGRDRRELYMACQRIKGATGG